MHRSGFTAIGAMSTPRSFHGSFDGSRSAVTLIGPRPMSMVSPETLTSPGNVPSTIVDGTAEVPRVLRLGALSLAELREVVPELLGPGEHAEAPE